MIFFSVSVHLCLDLNTRNNPLHMHDTCMFYLVLLWFMLGTPHDFSPSNSPDYLGGLFDQISLWCEVLRVTESARKNDRGTPNRNYSTC